MAIISVDAMGGDFAPQAVIEGVSEALEHVRYIDKLLLVGVPEAIESELNRVGCANHPKLEIVAASQVVGMDESAATAIRKKRDSSISVAVDLVKQGRAAAVVSAGHTGAAVAATVVKLRMIEGIERPGIATVFPSPSGPFVLLDAGANVDSKPLHLLHYAIMGDVYARKVLGHERPRVGLLNVGEEDKKGNDLTRIAHAHLRQMPHLNFIGNVEGRDLFGGNVDVVVCDGFVGNVVLKSCEGLAKSIGDMLKNLLKKNMRRKIGALLAKDAFTELKETCDYAAYGGAPLLGVDGVCIIGHGSSNPKAIRNAIRVAGEFVHYQVNDHIKQRIIATNASVSLPPSEL